ncbi:MAG: alkaline phosphatase, partial [Myxococcota bacterium]
MGSLVMRSTVALLVGLVSCTAGGNAPIEAAAEPAATGVKNIIFFIGDGMGPQQIGLLELYAHRAPGSIYAGQPTTLETIMDASVMGLSRHDPAEALVVDSACSASQLASGQPVLSEVISLDVHGQPVETVLERASKLGRATGLVSDTRITHATPAAFAAHVPHRDMENEIAVQLLETAPDVMLSGGIRYFLPQDVNDSESGAKPRMERLTQGAISPIKSKRKDDRNLLFEARDAGYDLAFSREMLDAAGDKVLGLFAYSGMLDGIAHHADDPARTEPSLAEMTTAAISRLSKDEDGFFLMVEGGQIDWAAHSNDAGTMLHEMVKFDEALAAAWEWAEGRDDTLIVITADHETGGFGLSYSRADVPVPRVIPGGAFEAAPYQPGFNFGAPAQLDGLYAQKQSFYALIAEFGGLPEGEQTAERLQSMFNAVSEFPITKAQAAAVMANEPNAYRVEGHGTLSVET